MREIREKGGRTGMKRYDYLIWDFNGTIYDDTEPCLRAANRLLARHGLPVIGNMEQYRAKFGFPIEDYYRRLGFDFDREPYADLAVEWLGYYLEETRDAGTFPEIPALLERIHAMGVRQIILSATKLAMLEEQVRVLGIRPYFTELLGLENIHAFSKEQIAQNWRKKHPDESLLLLGDTDHDAAVARSIGADFVLFCCGHQSREHLKECRPLLLLDRPADLPIASLLAGKP